MLPKALKEYAGSILSSIFFGSNFWFWKLDSYTAEPSLLKPFLHTWSLSVEEQFYLLFPILLLVLWKFLKHHILLVCISILIISLCLAQWASTHYVDANFYLLPTRIWELSAGVILAVWQSSVKASRVNLSTKVREAGQILAAAILLFSFVLFDHETKHPSLVTLLPILATTLIIFASQPQLLITRLLSQPLFTLIGKWSYSLYLWHFPVFAFARLHGIAESIVQKLVLIIISIILASLTYYWIEQPARRKDSIHTSAFTSVTGVWFSLLLTCMLFFYISEGAPQRLGVVRDLFDSAQIIEVNKDTQDCHQRPADIACFFHGEQGKPILINAGDSHGKTLGNDLKKVAKNLGFSYFQLTANNCPLIRNAYSLIGTTLNNNCHPAEQAKRMARIKSMSSSNIIIIMSARYPLYLSSEGFDNRQGGVEEISPIWVSDELHKKNDVSVSQSLIQSTFNELLDTGAKVLMVYPIPEAGWDIPKLVRKKLDSFPASQKLNAFKSFQITTSYKTYKERALASFQVLDSVSDRPNLIRVFPSEVLCDKVKDQCYTHSKDALYYHDDDHLGPAGSALVVGQLEAILKKHADIKQENIEIMPSKQ